MDDREKHAVNDIELSAEATIRQLEDDGLGAGAWFEVRNPAPLWLDADIHLLIVAAEHLRVALHDAPNSPGLGVLPEELADPVRNFRDVLAHRDQHLRDSEARTAAEARRRGPTRAASDRMDDELGT